MQVASCDTWGGWARRPRWPGVIAVAFRTDKPLDRKSNGKSIDGSAGVKGHRNSLSTFVKAGKPSYIA